MNSEKSCLSLFGSNSVKVSVFFDMNPEESGNCCLQLFCGNSLKVSVDPFYRFFGVGAGREVRYHLDISVMYLNDNIVYAENAKLRESTTGSKTFV